MPSNKTGEEPYNPETVDQDQLLKDREKALEVAESLLAEDPNNPAYLTMVDSMRDVVEQRQRQLGLIPPETPDVTS